MFIYLHFMSICDTIHLIKIWSEDMIKHHNNSGLSVEITLIDVGEEENAVINPIPPNQRFHYIVHYIVKGKGIFKSSTQETYKLSAGDAFAIYKNDTVYYESDHNNPLHYYWVGFNGSDSEKIMQYLGFSKTRQVVPLKNFTLIKTAFDNLLYSNANKDAYNTLANFFECLKVIRQSNYTTPASVLVSDTLLSSAISYMETNLDKNILVEDVAKYLKVDRSSFAKKFKAKFNIPPHRYLLKLKLSKAEMLLEMSEYNISEISELLGFTDTYIFSKIFKKHYGISPNAYRKLRNFKKANRSKS